MATYYMFMSPLGHGLSSSLSLLIVSLFRIFCIYFAAFTPTQSHRPGLTLELYSAQLSPVCQRNRWPS
jgi:hypothetical protein